jgi:xylose dehydrogenase (NAD/NADP)
MSGSPLRLGILGTARIARSFCEGVAPSEHVTVAAVASRFAGRARSFARDFNIPRSFDSYAALLADRELDAIYNPLPNSLHAEWSIRALRAGKHVLCEKPLAPTAREARAVFDAARAQGVHVVEGFPFRAQPQTLKMRELIDDGAIGRVQFIQAHFTFSLDAAADIRLQRELAGGALMDVGCYSVSLVRMIAGQLPSRVAALARWDASGVDRSLVATLEFPCGLLAQIASGFDAALERYALIVGTEGAIQTTFFNHPPRDRPAELLLKQGRASRAPYQSISVPALNGFLAEAEAFERLVRPGGEQWPGATPEESIDVALTLEALLRSARSGMPVRTEPGTGP